ncbi:MAG: hypothetical protein M3124_05440 [Actinomycetota bacterium]|nr:hypothetical protein [Actinomycetota bacterium]
MSEMFVRRVAGTPRFKLCVVILLLAFFVLCGVHLAGIHHHGDGDELGLATTVAGLLAMAAVAQALWRQLASMADLVRGWPPLEPVCGPPIRAPIRT